MTEVLDPLQAREIDRKRPRPWADFWRRRLIRFVVSLWALVTFSFLIVHLVPGDPVRAALGLTADPGLVAARRQELGLDDPLIVQYWNFLRHLVSGDLGVGIGSRLPVMDTITERLGNTLQLAILAFLVVVVISVPLGVGMAIVTRGGRRRIGELGFTSTAVAIASIPEFLLAVALVSVLGVSWQWLPIAGKVGFSSYLMPVMALAIGPALALARLIRIETLSVLGADFIRTARAKRLRPRLIYLRHALPNALTATLTIGGLLLSGLITGTVLVETVFAWPGLGPTTVAAIINKDFPLIQGIVLVYGGLILLITLLVDVLLAVVDPRSTIRES